MYRKLPFASLVVLCGLVLLGSGGFTPVQAQSPYQRQMYYQWLQQQRMQQYRLQQQMMHQQFQMQFRQMAVPQYVPDFVVPPQRIQQGQFQQQQGWVWTGTETLAGYGALTFRLSPNGQAVMIDAKETSTGAWARMGNTMTLTFGGVVYTGSIDGRTMAGTARDNRNEWTFSVNLQ